MVEFILVPECRFLTELFQPVLLGFVVARTVHIVFVFLEQAEPGSVSGLGAFFVVSPGEGVCMSAMNLYRQGFRGRRLLNQVQDDTTEGWTYF